MHDRSKNEGFFDCFSRIKEPRKRQLNEINFIDTVRSTKSCIDNMFSKMTFFHRKKSPVKREIQRTKTRRRSSIYLSPMLRTLGRTHSNVEKTSTLFTQKAKSDLISLVKSDPRYTFLRSSSVVDTQSHNHFTRKESKGPLIGPEVSNLPNQTENKKIRFERTNTKVPLLQLEENFPSFVEKDSTTLRQIEKDLKTITANQETFRSRRNLSEVNNLYSSLSYSNLTTYRKSEAKKLESTIYKECDMVSNNNRSISKGIERASHNHKSKIIPKLFPKIKITPLEKQIFNQNYKEAKKKFKHVAFTIDSDTLQVKNYIDSKKGNMIRLTDLVRKLNDEILFKNGKHFYDNYLKYGKQSNLDEYKFEKFKAKGAVYNDHLTENHNRITAKIRLINGQASKILKKVHVKEG